MRLDEIPKVQLATVPTPLEEAPRLAAELGLERLLFKRDDQTGLALGGNKARKLEYLMADAIAKGCDMVITDGGPQSNHARMTAAAARKLGLDVKLVLAGPDFEEFQGNLLLDVILGAEILFVKGGDVPEMEVEMDRMVRDLTDQGRRPYLVPIGGSTAVGALGYVRAMRELAGQLDDGPVQIVLAVGSCGTFAGTALGCRLFLPEARPIGISVSRRAEAIQKRAAELANASSDLIEAGITVEPESLEAYHDYVGPAYGVPTSAGREAILTTAQTEGILLDPVYTGKAMSGLFDLARREVLDPSVTTVFLHTGGTPALFAFEGEFSPLASCTKK